MFSFLTGEGLLEGREEEGKALLSRIGRVFPLSLHISEATCLSAAAAA